MFFSNMFQLRKNTWSSLYNYISVLNYVIVLMVNIGAQIVANNTTCIAKWWSVFFYKISGFGFESSCSKTFFLANIFFHSNKHNT